MKRVIVVGPGAAGKSTLAARLGEITRLPVIELDRLF
jgi:adenylate kinase family enzyme